MTIPIIKERIVSVFVWLLFGILVILSGCVRDKHDQSKKEAEEVQGNDGFEAKRIGENYFKFNDVNYELGMELIELSSFYPVETRTQHMILKLSLVRVVDGLKSKFDLSGIGFENTADQTYLVNYFEGGESHHFDLDLHNVVPVDVTVFFLESLVQSLLRNVADNNSKNNEILGRQLDFVNELHLIYNHICELPQFIDGKSNSEIGLFMSRIDSLGRSVRDTSSAQNPFADSPQARLFYSYLETYYVTRFNYSVFKTYYDGSKDFIDLTEDDISQIKLDLSKEVGVECQYPESVMNLAKSYLSLLAISN